MISLHSKGTYQLFVGNPDQEQEIDFTVDKDEQVIIPPGSWVSVKVKLDSKNLSFETSGQTYLAAPCFLGDRRPETTNILLISVDTLRADYFTKEHMPLCFSFFEEGAVFTRAYSPVPWTLPAHASLFTSLYPATHSVRKPEHKLKPELDTLADKLANNGYYCLAVTEGNYLDPMYGMAQGFHEYHSVPPKLSSADPEEASKLSDNIHTMNTFLTQQVIPDHLPLFVFFHTYEVHCPFIPRQGETALNGIGTTQWLLDHELNGFTASDVVKLKQLYASEVAYTDTLIHDFISKLDPEKWTIVLMSDHGEEFGEHGGLLHADTLFEEVLRVPIAMKGPTIQKATISNPTSLLDIAPTLLALVTPDIPKSWQGHDLLSESGFASNDKERILFSETFFLGPHIPSKDPRILGFTKGVKKLIQKRNHGEFEAWYFNLSQDPEEKTNLLNTQEAEVARFYPLLEAYSNNKQESLNAGEMSEEQREVMRSLGYIE